MARKLISTLNVNVSSRFSFRGKGSELVCYITLADNLLLSVLTFAQAPHCDHLDTFR